MTQICAITLLGLQDGKFITRTIKQSIWYNFQNVGFATWAC
jgi:hypothetical protein